MHCCFKRYIKTPEVDLTYNQDIWLLFPYFFWLFYKTLKPIFFKNNLIKIYIQISQSASKYKNSYSKQNIEILDFYKKALVLNFKEILQLKYLLIFKVISQVQNYNFQIKIMVFTQNSVDVSWLILCKHIRVYRSIIKLPCIKAKNE